MRRSKQVLLALGVGVVVAGGGAGLAQAGSSSTASTSVASKTVAAPAGTASVKVTTATVGGKSEQVLVDAKGLPLYTYALDTSTQSHVSGGLAALWPPLVSGSPSETGATGKLSVLADSNGPQVLYNGHFLYTFVDDSPGPRPTHPPLAGGKLLGRAQAEALRGPGGRDRSAQVVSPWPRGRVGPARG
jgi:predicted lipoprotein with Yx(FWY)xxD motif